MTNVWTVSIIEQILCPCLHSATELTSYPILIPPYFNTLLLLVTQSIGDYVHTMYLSSIYSITY